MGIDNGQGRWTRGRKGGDKAKPNLDLGSNIEGFLGWMHIV